MKKRILSMLLAAAILISDGGSLYAAGTLEGPQQNLTEQGSEAAQQEPELPGDTEGGEPQEPETPGGEDGDGEERQEYTINFDLNGGLTQDGQESMSIQVKEGEIPDISTLTEPKKTGYTFQGWLDEAGNIYQFDQPVTGNLTLSASWTPITYRIQFDLNGGTGEEIPELVCIYDQEEALPLDAGKKSGFVFLEWTLGGTAYQGGSNVKNLADQEGAVVVLKASWAIGKFKIRFDANGGTGTMKEETFACNREKQLYANKYKRTGYTFQGWNSKKDGTGTAYQDEQKAIFNDQEDGNTVVLYAMWKGNSYTVTYDGNGASSGTTKNSKHTYGTGSALNDNGFQRTGYKFAGWNTQKDGKGKTYKAGAKVTDLATKQNGTVVLYAKWSAVKYNITYKLNGGKLASSAKKVYTITKAFNLPVPTRKNYDFDGWYTDKKLKKRISQIPIGSSGDKTFYAKWVKCSRSPKSNSAKLTACKGTGTNKIKITATVKNRIKSDDDIYYLVYVDPISGKSYKMAQKSYKKKSLSFVLKPKENQGYAVSKFGIAVKVNGKYKLISSTSFVKNAEKTASNKSKYKLGKTKKGMQFYNSMAEIDECGAKNNFLNLTASMVFGSGTVPYQYNGKTYYFDPMDAYRQIVSECNKKGINVTMQIMLDWTAPGLDLIYPSARVSGAAPFYSWNVYDRNAREKMEAIFCYVGGIFGKKDCYVSNWVLGNEVNNPKNWNYASGMTDYKYFRTYAYAFRALYYAVRSQYSNARIFICTDNFWNTSPKGGYSAKRLISSFTSHLNSIQKGLKWNLAYHAYSFPLTYTNFWAGYGITNNVNSPYITMKNLKVLTNYIKKTYGSSVRIILSEQGYSSSWGQANQAAAIAASYYIAACNPMVDAFIIRSYYDHPVEVAQGLRMGIHGKEAFEAFKYMDTSKFGKYTNQYLKVIKIKKWSGIVPGYKKSRIYKMYAK